MTGVSLDKATASIAVGGTDTLVATVTPNNATVQTVTWSSDDTSIVDVNAGTITGVAAGTATITVTTVDGGFTDTCAVTVS